MAEKEQNISSYHAVRITAAQFFLFAFLLEDHCPWVELCWWRLSLICTYWRCSLEIVWSLHFSQKMWASLGFPLNPPPLAAVSLSCIAKPGFKAHPNVCSSSVTLYWMASNNTEARGMSSHRERGKKNHVQGSLGKNLFLPAFLQMRRHLKLAWRDWSASRSSLYWNWTIKVGRGVDSGMGW